MAGDIFDDLLEDEEDKGVNWNYLICGIIGHVPYTSKTITLHDGTWYQETCNRCDKSRTFTIHPWGMKPPTPWL